MARFQLADRSALRRRIRFNRTVIITAVVSFIMGFYTAIQLSFFATVEPPENDSMILTELLPSIDSIEEFYVAQAGQDKWIFEILMGSNVEAMRNRGGFFLEFGARNGVEHSNTYFFETFLDWYGLLIEANPSEQGNIVTDRPNSAVVNGAICEKEGGNVTFLDISVGGWGGVTASYDKERLADKMSMGKEFEVPCHRLDTLVNYFGISQVDLMTVDTEGSELTALQTFPFDRVKPKLIAVELLEGNEERAQYRKELESFLETKGYKMFHEYWVSRELTTLDAFFTLNGETPSFSDKSVSSQHRKVFRGKTKECKTSEMCL